METAVAFGSNRSPGVERSVRDHAEGAEFPNGVADGVVGQCAVNGYRPGCGGEVADTVSGLRRRR